MDGIYAMTFRGALDWGMGMLVLRRGTVTGADASGVLYDGSYSEAAETIFLDVKMTVPPGVTLVVGTPPQPRSYVVPLNAAVSKSFIENSEPILLHLPVGPVNVILRRLRRLED